MIVIICCWFILFFFQILQYVNVITPFFFIIPYLFSSLQILFRFTDGFCSSIIPYCLCFYNNIVAFKFLLLISLPGLGFRGFAGFAALAILNRPEEIKQRLQKRSSVVSSD